MQCLTCRDSISPQDRQVLYPSADLAEGIEDPQRQIIYKSPQQ